MDKTILLVEPDHDICTLLQVIIQHYFEHYQFNCVRSYEEAESYLNMGKNVNLIICELTLNGFFRIFSENLSLDQRFGGISFINKIRRKNPNLGIIIFSTLSEDRFLSMYTSPLNFPYTWIEKPTKNETIVSAISTYLNPPNRP